MGDYETEYNLNIIREKCNEIQKHFDTTIDKIKKESNFLTNCVLRKKQPSPYYVMLNDWSQKTKYEALSTEKKIEKLESLELLAKPIDEENVKIVAEQKEILNHIHTIFRRLGIKDVKKITFRGREKTVPCSWTSEIADAILPNPCYLDREYERSIANEIQRLKQCLAAENEKKRQEAAKKKAEQEIFDRNRYIDLEMAKIIIRNNLPKETNIENLVLNFAATNRHMMILYLYNNGRIDECYQLLDNTDDRDDIIRDILKQEVSSALQAYLLKENLISKEMLQDYHTALALVKRIF